MKEFKYVWAIGLIGTIALILAPVILFWPKDVVPQDDPWANMPVHPTHTDHSAIIQGEFETGPDVTRACLTCHAEAGEEMLHSVHYKWKGEPVLLPGRDEPVTIGATKGTHGILEYFRGLID